MEKINITHESVTEIAKLTAEGHEIEYTNDENGNLMVLLSQKKKPAQGRLIH